MIKDFLRQHGNYRDDMTFKDLTTIKMGGDIAHYVEPNNLADLKEIINYLKNNHIPFKVLGNGSNMICGSSKYEGVVIRLTNFNNFEIDNDVVYVEAGVKIPYLCGVLANNSLSGLEFASGIPGSAGGLIYMNAGAYKKEMADVVKEVLLLKDGEIVRLSKEELGFNYRYSIFQEHPHWVIVACYLQLKKTNSEDIKMLMNDRLERRKKSQPLDKPSAGSCFRNPSDKFAWELIDGIGYRGYKLNGVEVSDKHSNFLINTGDGKGEDYLTIALDIQDKVRAKYDIKLVMEAEKFNC